MDTIISRSPEDTTAAGQRLAKVLPSGAVVALDGDLGAGKTVFAQGLCLGFGSTAEVTSPTFTLVHEYPSPDGVIVHTDFYRLTTLADAAALGLEELWAGARCGIVEWAERYPALLPPHNVRVRLRIVSPTVRHIEFA